MRVWDGSYRFTTDKSHKTIFPMEKTPRYQFNYTELEELLTTVYFPHDLGNRLDEILCDLVHYAGKEEEYAEQLPNRYYLVKQLRDIFWSLEK